DALADLLVHIRDGGPLNNRNVVSRCQSLALPVTGEFNNFGRAKELERLPAYDLIDFSHYYGDGYRNGMPFHKSRAGAVLATRGCPFTCDFCFNYWGGLFTKRSVASVIEELYVLERTYQVTNVFFVDFTFTIDSKWVAEFCSLYRSKGLSIHWSCE